MGYLLSHHLRGFGGKKVQGGIIKEELLRRGALGNMAAAYTASAAWGRGHFLPPGILVPSSLSIPEFTPSNPLPSVFPHGGFK